MRKCDTKYRVECEDVEQEEIVLIGGSFDHQVIFIDKSTTSYVQLQIINTRGKDNHSETYVLKTMKGTGHFFRVGVYQDLNMDDVMSLLIEDYKEEPKINAKDLVEVED